MISVQNINKFFGSQQVLSDISVDFEEGKTNLIIGASGSGKTVLLKAIAGLHNIDSGRILYDKTDFITLDHKKRITIHKQMGMLFQGAALFDFATARENVRFPLDFFTDWSLSRKDERVDFCLNRVNLGDIGDKYPSELSGGMQKRVGIARAIVMNPGYLFCDEPNSGLDPQTAIVIDRLISELTHEYRMTTIINTHDMNSVMAIGEKVVFLYKGKKEWEGSRDTILQSSNKALNDFVFASEMARLLKEPKF
ncbi:MAG TPA: ATP-binding cassette domain-containing protein [Bacteroidales bacterium]|nr:MAG: Sulfate/thiosulfate import ATP-binding protein CysA [Bacteroidetes bacterium ADurb.Bin139]HOG25078.1 ATP-binding cassette domain-containing protein [Bacteroidales bacterium]HOR11885.1 ATP-binding cassette domain-containing protein [Bacteroidales bacterium]HPK38646.1 ATP-binding cassette domain-containing protein [Bacteroidales bacterium]